MWISTEFPVRRGIWRVRSGEVLGSPTYTLSSYFLKRYRLKKPSVEDFPGLPRS
jgi:hypothetical protein